MKSVFFYGILTSLSRFVSFLLLPLFTRYFSVVEYGKLDIYQTILGLLLLLGLMQFDTAFQRYYYTYKSDEFISTTVITVGIISLFIVGLFSLLFSLPIEDIFFIFEKKILIVYVLLVPVSNCVNILLILLRYNDNRKVFLVAILVQLSLIIITTLTCIVILQLGIISIFIGQVVGFISIFIFLIFVLNKQLRLIINKDYVLKLLKFSVPQLPARLGSYLNLYIGRVFILKDLTYTEVGIYSFSSKIAIIVQIFHIAFSMAWYPVFYKHIESLERNSIYRNIYTVLLVTLVMIFSFISLFSYEIVLLIGTIEYLESYKYIGIISFSTLLLVIKEVVDIGPKIFEKTYLISITYIFSLFVNLTILFSYDHISLELIAYSLLISNFLLLLLSWYISNKQISIEYSKVFFLLFLISCTVIYIISRLYYDNFLVKGIVFVIIIVAIVYSLIKKITLNKVIKELIK